MSLQWTLIAGVLYVEVAIVLLLILPLFSPSRWNRFLNSSFIKTLSSQASWYFYFVIVILVLFLLDAVREMRKYSNIETNEHSHHQHLDLEMQTNMRLFRAQRNFYISGFALFLSFVIRRLLHLMSIQAILIAKSEAALRQAKSASDAAKDILERNADEGEATQSREDEIKELKDKIKALQEQLTNAFTDKEAVKSQAASVTKEYDRLLDEHRKLQENLSGSGDKKRE